MSQSTIAGVCPVLPTVFDDAGGLDHAGLAAVVEYVVASGAEGTVFPGLASEYDMLALDEREALIATVGEAVDGRIGFIVGASSDSVADSVRLAQAGARAGASAAMVMTPRTLGGDLAAIGAFYEELGRSAGVPILLQNAPAPMGLGLTPEQVVAVAASTDAIRWVKEETMPCGQRISALRAAAQAGGAVPHLAGVFGGAGGRYLVDELHRGAIGSMPAAETPEVHVALMAAHRRGDEATVRGLYEALLPILMVQAVFRWRLTKEVLVRRGVIASAHTRAAGPAFDAEDLKELDVILARLEDAHRRLA